MPKSVFISHSAPELAAELKRLLDDAFTKDIKVFNSAAPDAGLPAGHDIAQGLIDEINKSDLVVWLATPDSVGKSFWMAWELGAARMANKEVIPCVARGLSAKGLPLMQSARDVPDLSDAEFIRKLVKDIAQKLDIQTSGIDTAINSLQAQGPNPFESAPIERVLSARVAGQRLIVENRTDTQLREVSFVTTDQWLSSALSAMTAFNPQERRRVGS